MESAMLYIRSFFQVLKITDIIDILLSKLSDIDTGTINDMTPGQIIRFAAQ